MPISSSAHVIAIPWLLGWDYQKLEPELKKSFEVALHAGTAGALLVLLAGEGSKALRNPARGELVAVAAGDRRLPARARDRTS
ncbi:MAG: undecaprenyl-diphosphate phosphatase, partial [Solirubrobacterales bacterium]|nr:undecaprenyl-diphosphate phosphatase [Solirubrobacterales bacterium]